MRWIKRALLTFSALLLGPLLMAAYGGVKLDRDWRSASRSSVGITTPAGQTSEAVVQVYAARAFNWRGIFAVHTWIATKPENARFYTVHQVVGWNSYRNLPVVVSRPDLPDRQWYGAEPQVLFELRGTSAAAVIPKIEAAIRDYPYPRRYVMWPGPNSNTFVAHVAREVPELKVDLPPTAIGKDFLPGGALIARAPSGTGIQLSLFGLAGLILAVEEGVELNVLTLGVGLDPGGPALRLPGIGRLGGS